MKSPFASPDFGPRLKTALAWVFLLSISAGVAAGCTGSCTYYNSGVPAMVVWSASCSGSSMLGHVSANALVGSTGYPCTPGDPIGSSSFTMCSGTFSGQEQWTQSQGAISSASIQIVDTNSGVFPIGCNAGAPTTAPPTPTPAPAPTTCPPPYQPTLPPCTLPPGSSATPPPTPTPVPSATPVCSSVSVNFQTGNYGGYPNPLSGRAFTAYCWDQYGASVACPTTPQWTASYGAFTITGNPAFWQGTGGQVLVSATVPGCGTGAFTYSPAVCSASVQPVFLSSAQLSLVPGAPNNPATGREFKANCGDQYAESFPCPAAPQWSATLGNMAADPLSTNPDYAYWYSQGTRTPVTVTASIASCGSPSTPYTPPYCQSPAITVQHNALPTPSPDPNASAPIPTENLTLSLRCYDQYNEQWVCPAAPAWSVTSGNLSGQTHDGPTDTYVQPWVPASIYGPFIFSASVDQCGGTTYDYFPPAVCAAVALNFTGTDGYENDWAAVPGLRPFLDAWPNDFWGYNWTEDWLNRTAGWKPFRIVGATCTDQYHQPIACTNLTWSANLGTFEGVLPPPGQNQTTVPFNLNAQQTIWDSSNVSGVADIRAISTYCGSAELNSTLHILDACALTPGSISMDANTAANFTAKCFDEAKRTLDCPYLLFPQQFPNPFGNVTSTQYRNSYSPPNYTPVLTPVFWGNSTVSVLATANNTSNYLIGGGPTFYCIANVTIGNPVNSCTVSVSNATPRVGQAVQLNVSCMGIKGPTDCPALNINNDGNALLQNITSQNAALTGTHAGALTVSVQGPPGLNEPGPGYSGINLTKNPGPAFACNATMQILPGPCSVLPAVLHFTGASTTHFDQILSSSGNLESVANLTLENQDVKIAYATDVFACGQDFDGGIRTGTGFLAVDSPRFNPSFSRPLQNVSIVLKNLPGNSQPRLVVFEGFAQTADDVFKSGQDCVAAGRCTNVTFDPDTHTLSFRTNGFSSYAAGGVGGVNDTAPLPPNVRFVLDCPLPQLGQNLTRASAFLYVDGQPVLNRTMVMDYTLNSTYAFQTQPVSVDAALGRHDFILDTRYDGRYLIVAQSGDWTSNTCPVDVFQQQSTQLPELPPALLGVVFLAVAAIVSNRKKRRETGP